LLTKILDHYTVSIDCAQNDGCVFASNSTMTPRRGVVVGERRIGKRSVRKTALRDFRVAQWARKIDGSRVPV